MKWGCFVLNESQGQKCHSKMRTNLRALNMSHCTRLANIINYLYDTHTNILYVLMYEMHHILYNY